MTHEPLRQVDTIAALRELVDTARTDGATVGFVPTMGYLHEGHLTLVRASVADCDLTVVSIFVNPLQFAAGEDLEAYPRDLDRDLAMVDSAGAPVVFTPSVDEMYPRPLKTQVQVPELSTGHEGASRPTHFTGVATVVAKLFAIVGPCRAYFGEKDFQQLAVVRRMVADLSMPVEVVGCPTVREPDGLAMSSRNSYLSADERKAAVVVHRALRAGSDTIMAGPTTPAVVRAVMADTVGREPLADLDYADVVDPDTLEPLEVFIPGASVRLLAAARVGRPRLLDNIGVVVPAGGGTGASGPDQ